MITDPLIAYPIVTKVCIILGCNTGSVKKKILVAINVFIKFLVYQLLETV